MADRLKVYIHSPSWYLRPKNTDWIYTTRVVPRIGEFIPDLEFVSARSISTTVRLNANYAGRTFSRRLGLNSVRFPRVPVDIREYRATGCNVVFCHDEFPFEPEPLPVIWHNSILDPDMVAAYGYSEEMREEDFRIKSEGFKSAALVQVSTDAEVLRLGRSFPEIADRFVSVPFFLPDIRVIDDAVFERKLLRDGPLRCIFVGREARRKGLPRVYDAIRQMPEAARKNIELTVISDQSDGKVQPLDFPNIKVYDGLPHRQVLAMLQESDVFVMPSLFESYGMVYIEAMSQGVIPIVPDWEVQREIVDYGRAGIVTCGQPEELAKSLIKIMEDREFRVDLARQARERFLNFYAPSVVAHKFRSAVERFFSS